MCAACILFRRLLVLQIFTLLLWYSLVPFHLECCNLRALTTVWGFGGELGWVGGAGSDSSKFFLDAFLKQPLRRNNYFASLNSCCKRACAPTSYIMKSRGPSAGSCFTVRGVLSISHSSRLPKMEVNCFLKCLAEPSPTHCLFMGMKKEEKRGRWKEEQRNRAQSSKGEEREAMSFWGFRRKIQGSVSLTMLPTSQVPPCNLRVLPSIPKDKAFKKKIVKYTYQGKENFRYLF